MRRRLHLTRKAWIAILVVVALSIWSLSNDLNWGFATNKERLLAIFWAAANFITSALAAHDSTRIQLRRYRTGISYGPVGLFLVCALFWPFALIWYLVVRAQIRDGTLTPKPSFRKSFERGPDGLIQPWRRNE